LEVADIFRGHGPAWRRANAGHVSLGQLKVMSAIESCRTAALGGHVARCENCAHSQISYNSCRNRHCPKCQGAAAKDWLAAREADLLPVPYYHVVFTLPAAIADIAYQNKTVIYDLLFKASAETLTTIAADPKHLGARVRAPVSVLRRPHGHHREVPAWLRATNPVGDISNRDQDRHVMISLGSWQRSSAAVRLRRLSTGDDHARPRAAQDSHLVVQSSSLDAGSAYRDRPTKPITSPTASQRGGQRTSATDRRCRNPHSA